MLYINKITELVSEKNLTQEALCKKIGITTMGYKKALDRKDFKASILTKLAIVLGVDESYFFTNNKKLVDENISLVEEPIKVYQRLDDTNYKNTVLEKLDKIIELLEKNINK